MKHFIINRIAVISAIIALILVTYTSSLYIKNAYDTSKPYKLAFDCLWDFFSIYNYQAKYAAISTVNFKNFSESDKKKLFKYIERKYKLEVFEVRMPQLIKNTGKDPKDGFYFGIYYYDSSTPDSVSFSGHIIRYSHSDRDFYFEAQKKLGIWRVISFPSEGTKPQEFFKRMKDLEKKAVTK